MTASNPRDIAEIPGKLCVNPTDLSLPFPHGGTGLGVVRTPIFRPGITYEEIHAEEFAEPVEYIATGQACVLAATLISWDEEALKELFWNTEAGAVSSWRGVKESAAGSNRAGFLLSSRSVVLLFSPNDADNAPMLLIRRALPMMGPAAEATLSLASAISVAVVFAGIRDASGRLYDWRRRKDITL